MGRDILRWQIQRKKVVQSIKIGPLFMNDRDEERLLAHNTRRQKYHKEYGKEYAPLKWSEGLKDKRLLLPMLKSF